MQTIGESAFYKCRNLQKVTFAVGSQLREIGEYAFLCCDNLKRISLPENIEVVPKGCFCASELEEIVIPRKVKKIGCAFYNCKNLRRVVFEQGSELAEIGSFAFQGCKSL